MTVTANRTDRKSSDQNYKVNINHILTFSKDSSIIQFKLLPAMNLAIRCMIYAVNRWTIKKYSHCTHNVCTHNRHILVPSSSPQLLPKL